uniref:Uncharacterized protein n=1 Tax=Arion vulgaris TaxID=1028688 RepID=A0A0B7A042_9EUPU
MKLVVVFGCHLLLAYLATVGSAGLLGIPNLKVLTSVKGTPSLPGKTIDIKRPQLPGQMIEILTSKLTRSKSTLEPDEQVESRFATEKYKYP